MGPYTALWKIGKIQVGVKLKSVLPTQKRDRTYTIRDREIENQNTAREAQVRLRRVSSNEPHVASVSFQEATSD